MPNTFIRNTLLRLALTYPFCAILSNSLTDVWDLLLIVFWVLGGQWKERIDTVRRSPILLVTMILIVVSFLGVFQYETNFFQSLKYWKGHNPFPILIILATILTKRSDRVRMIRSLALACLILLPYSICVRYFIPPEIRTYFKLPHTALNTIWLGMAFVVWGGVALCVPASWHIPSLFRRLFGKVKTAGTEATNVVSAGVRALSCRIYGPGLYRYAIFFFCIICICINSSRTSCVAILVGTVTMFFVRRRKAWIIASLLLCFVAAPAAYYSSTVFHYKALAISGEINWFIETLADSDAQYGEIIGGRLHLYWNLSREILHHPLGIGMEKTCKKCLEYSNNHLDNTHNEFIAYGMHSGYLGLACLIAWFWTLFRRSLKMTPPWRSLGLFVCVTLFVACMFNGALSQDMEGHLYCILIALIAAADAANRCSGAATDTATGIA